MANLLDGKSFRNVKGGRDGRFDGNNGHGSSSPAYVGGLEL